MQLLFVTMLWLSILSCHHHSKSFSPRNNPITDDHDSTIGSIPLPTGFRRLDQADHSFGAWLRNLHLKNDKRVFLYNGQLKSNQQVQYAVLDISVGTKDLQQCADAVMRLRAEYFFQDHKDDS